MTVERGNRTEQREVPQPAELYGLQFRLAARGALNEVLDPSRQINLPQNADAIEQQQTITPEMAQLIQRRSTEERAQVSRTEAQWAQDMSQYLQTELAALPDIQRTSARIMLRNMGFDQGMFSPQEAQAFYNRYCRNTDASNVQRFVREAIAQLNGIQSEESRRNLLPFLRNICSVFGNQSQEVIYQQILYEFRASTPEGRAEQAAHVGEAAQLQQRETELLNFLRGDGQNLEPQPEPPPAPEPPPDPDAARQAELQRIREQTQETKPSESVQIEVQQPEPGMLDIPQPQRQVDPAELDDIRSRVELRKQEDGIVVSPEGNKFVALEFCRRLRERVIADANTQSTRRTVGGRETVIWRDPQTGFKFTSPNREGIISAWTVDQPFLEWAEQNNMPMAMWTKGGIHFTALLRGPFYDAAEKKWFVTIYDPMQQGEQNEEVQVKEPFETFYNREVQKYEYVPELKVYLAPENPDTSGSGIVVGRTRINEADMRMALYHQWLQQAVPPGRGVHANRAATQMMMNNAFDLTLSGDTELPPHVIAAKQPPLQDNVFDCGPLSFFATTMRYLAKGGNEAEQKQLQERFRNQFNILLLNRKQLLGQEAIPGMTPPPEPTTS